MTNATEATWAQKVQAIKLAGLNASTEALNTVTRHVNSAIAHMTQQNCSEYDCASDEEYIFKASAHLIKDLSLPFDDALSCVLRTDDRQKIAQQSAVTNMATPGNVVATVQHLRAKLDKIDEELEWVDSAEVAQPLQAEIRIIRATLGAIYAEYGVKYFDEPVEAPEPD